MPFARSLPIGALARETGVKVPTIRFYEAIGLLPVPDRATNGRRIYGPDAVRRLKFIRHARELGFEVGAIRQLLELADQPEMPCRDVDAVAHAHLADIDSRIARLSALRAEVQRMLNQCSRSRIADCRVIEVLAHHDQCLHTDHRADKSSRPARVPTSRTRARASAGAR
jgi:DNA-binding transcriptional MerR regulator